MARRYYLCGVSGDGLIDTPFEPSVLGALTPEANWQRVDCRADVTSPAGEMLVWADLDDTQHEIIDALSGVIYVPFENSSGDVLTINHSIGDISAANRSAIQTALENRHVPMQGLQLSDSIAVVLRRFISRCRIRQYLVANDYTELLDNAVSSINSTKRQNIATRLTNLGFDLSGITGSTTIREALRLLIIQDKVSIR